MPGHERIEQRYLRLHDAATYLSLSPKTLYAWSERGAVPAYKLGRLWRFDREELDRFLRGEMRGVNIQSAPGAVGLSGKESPCQSGRTHEQGSGITGSTEEGHISKVDSGRSRQPGRPKQST